MKKYMNQANGQQLAETALSVVMAKWGKEMRDNRISNDAHRAEERRWKERGGGRDGRPFKHGWKPKRELPQLLAEIKEKARAKCAETDDVDACHKKMWLAWHKWLGREEGYGRYVRTKVFFPRPPHPFLPYVAAHVSHISHF